jgi:uracil-DNA glycosylase
MTGPRALRTLRTLRTLGTLSTLSTPSTLRTLIGCYHPSRQNTNTGTVTPAMYDAVFQRALKPFTSR